VDFLCSSVTNSCSSLDGFDTDIFLLTIFSGMLGVSGMPNLQIDFSLVDVMYNVSVFSHETSEFLTQDSRECRASCTSCASQAKPERNWKRRKVSSWQSVSPRLTRKSVLSGTTTFIKNRRRPRRTKKSTPCASNILRGSSRFRSLRDARNAQCSDVSV